MGGSERLNSEKLGCVDAAGEQHSEPITLVVNWDADLKK